MSSATRRGARRPCQVPAEVLQRLEEGEESVNHMEQIAMDMGSLLEKQFPECSYRADELRGVGLVSRMRAGGVILLDSHGLEMLNAATRWRSDTARGWATMAIGAESDLTLAERLRLIGPFADDSHFAVREWAWLSLRPHVAADPLAAVQELENWAQSESFRLRRFASEVTRPRGVWSQHIPLFKAEPDAACPILDRLKGDPSRYVQDSVANWLNDASKTRPEWVRSVCREWAEGAGSPNTARICWRATRTLRRHDGS